jgi:AcrR family transcriptional regulator
MADENNPCITKRLILDAARSRFMHYGYKKTTIDEIAADAGVGKGTVYLYFGNKEEILLTIAAQVKRNITEQMRAIAASLASPEERLRRMALASILSVHDAAKTTTHGVELVDEMLRPQIMKCGMAQREAQYDLLAEVLEEGVQRGEFSLVEGDAQRAARLFMLALVSFYPPYMDPCHGQASCKRDLENRANRMLDFLFAGLRRRDPQ